MTGWSAGLPRRERWGELIANIDGDPGVLGVILTGSWAHDMATEHSDLDLLLIVDAPSDRWQRRDEGGLDLSVATLAQLGVIPEDPERWWDRYRLTRIKVLLDRTEGEITRLIGAWGRLDDIEAHAALDFYLEPYVTYTRRSLKEFRNHRDGHGDAVEAMPWLIRLVFALHNRVRATNKYLRWELEHFPIGAPGWEAERIMDLYGRILATGDPAAQREAFAMVEPLLRARGFGGSLDGWGSDLDIFRSELPAATASAAT